jgi:hypothetical protein
MEFLIIAVYTNSFFKNVGKVTGRFVVEYFASNSKLFAASRIKYFLGL